MFIGLFQLMEDECHVLDLMIAEENSHLRGGSSCSYYSYDCKGQAELDRLIVNIIFISGLYFK